MILQQTHSVLRRAESALTANDALPVLRELTFDDFADLTLRLPLEQYPNLSDKMPSMASEETQRIWTGWSGHALLLQSVAFWRSVDAMHLRCNGTPISGLTMLDFGCGWGRLMRLALYFTNPEKLFGYDPWDKSLEECIKHRVLGQFALSAYVPQSIPFDQRFQLIYSFSVFTHLSPRTTQICLATLRKSIAPGGLLVITVRPIDYWSGAMPGRAQELEEAHRSAGYAFVPQQDREPIDGDVSYGDASIEPSYFERFKDWKLVGVDRNLCDGQQILLAFRPHAAVA